MAAYDASKDREIMKRSAIRTETAALDVGAYSYGGGRVKLQVSRRKKDKESGEFVFDKLGRMDMNEADAVSAVMQGMLRELRSQGYQ